MSNDDVKRYPCRVCNGTGIIMETNIRCDCDKQSELVREKLIEELEKEFVWANHITLEAFASYILARDKKNSEPLVRWNDEEKKGCFGNDYNNHLEAARKANRQTLKNLGAE